MINPNRYKALLGGLGGAVSSYHSTARRNLDRGDASAVKHDEPFAVFRTQRSRGLCQGRDHMIQQLVLIGDAGLVVRYVHAVAADEPYAQHCSRHVIKLPGLSQADAIGGITARPV